MDDPKIIDGRKIAQKHQEKLKQEIARLTTKPKMVSILVGEDPSSILYSKIKQKKAAEIEIDFEWVSFPEDTPYLEVVNKIQQLNQDQSVQGIMVQLPVPESFLTGHTELEFLQNINPEKDVDGLTQKGPFVPAAVAAVLIMLKDQGISVQNKKVVVIGASDLVGKPLALELEKLGGKISVCNSKTLDLAEETKEADIIISATGIPGILTGDMIKEGVVVIDVGTSKVNGKIVGDVDFSSVYPKALKITPVPGGVGPVTVVCLMENVVRTCITRPD